MLSDLLIPYHHQKYTIDRLTREDLDEIADWPKYTHPYAWANFSVKNDLLKDRWMTKNVRLDNLWLVFKFEGKIIGRASLIEPEERDELIFGIVMRPDLIEQGLGSKCIRLVAEMIFSSSDYSAIWLESKIDNNRAIHVWEKLGFEDTGMHYRKDVYGVYARYKGFRLTKEQFHNH
ncbi:MAG: GNAT family N-acetyltransferase [Candidatus Heimdallarchaeota archaeon]|nr:GNAT family N-acetyltransferase [Candidatus Heimdallarchaeota archaeon]